MARKKRLKTPPYVKYVFIGILTLGLGFVAVNRTKYLFSHIDYFKVRSVTIDPSLQFINKNDLRNLMGKNIFTVDLKLVQRNLNYKYPQASKLKVVKQFPNRIAVLAKKRVPFGQMSVQNKNAILDKEGVILSLEREKDKTLPEIIGARLNDPQLVPGLPLRGSDIWLTLKIIDLFEANSSLDPYSIKNVNIENMSKIIISLSNQLDVIIDKERVDQRIKVLGIVLAQDRLDLKDVKYIDLRFKEPIIGKK